MKTIVAAAIGLAVVGLVSPALAADPSGIWTWTSTFDSQTRECAVKLRLDSEGSILSGVYFDDQSNQGAPIAPAIFNEEDGRISFAVIREYSGEKVTIRYQGTVSGDTITGRCQFEGGGQVQSTSWTARRQR